METKMFKTPLMTTEWYSMIWCPTCQLYKNFTLRSIDKIHTYECSEGHFVKCEDKSGD